MAEDEENISKILSVLSHRIRRQILLILHEKGETSFTDIMNTLKIDTGRLSFHMRSLSPFIEQAESGKYKLSQAGEDAVRVIRDVQSWAQISAISRKASALPMASFKQRTYAFLIDYMVMFLLTLPLLLPTLASVLESNWTIVFLNLLFIALVFVWGYSTILEGFKGQTLGKRAMHLLAIKADGKKIDYEHAVVRNFGKILLPFDLLLGYRLKDPKFIRYFDKFAGTTVIELQQKTKPQQIADLNAKEET